MDNFFKKHSKLILVGLAIALVVFYHFWKTKEGFEQQFQSLTGDQSTSQQSGSQQTTSEQTDSQQTTSEQPSSQQEYPQGHQQSSLTDYLLYQQVPQQQQTGSSQQPTVAGFMDYLDNDSDKRTQYDQDSSDSQTGQTSQRKQSDQTGQSDQTSQGKQSSQDTKQKCHPKNKVSTNAQTASSTNANSSNSAANSEADSAIAPFMRPQGDKTTQRPDMSSQIFSGIVPAQTTGKKGSININVYNNISPGSGVSKNNEDRQFTSGLEHYDGNAVQNVHKTINSIQKEIASLKQTCRSGTWRDNQQRFSGYDQRCLQNMPFSQGWSSSGTQQFQSN